MDKKTRARGKQSDDSAKTKGVHALSFAESPSVTHQEFQDSTNINLLVKQWRKGKPLPVKHQNLQYGDFSGGEDFRSALDRIMEAEDSFLSLPAALREECENDPAIFLDMVADPESRERLMELGLDGKTVKAAAKASPEAPGSPEAADAPKPRAKPATAPEETSQES